MKTIKIILIMFTVGFFVGCEKQINDINLSDPERQEDLLKTNPTCSVDLVSGQAFTIGSVDVIYNTSSEIVVNYQINAQDWCFIETNVDIQVNPDYFPLTQSGNPIVGHFAFGNQLSCESLSSYTIDLSQIPDWSEGDMIYIAAHAEVSFQSGQAESCWGNGFSFPGNNWAMYFQCEPPVCEFPEFIDNFLSDSRDQYEIIYNSNNNGILQYNSNEMIFQVGSWNGLYVKLKQEIKFPPYIKVVMKQSNFGSGTSYDYGQFILGISELGSQVPYSWPQIYRMNEIWINVFGNKIDFVMREDEDSNPNSYGTQVIHEVLPASYNSNQWYTVEFIRDGLDVDIFIDDQLIKEVIIPDLWLDLDFNIIVGGDTHNGYDASISYLEYGCLD